MKHIFSLILSLFISLTIVSSQEAIVKQQIKQILSDKSSEWSLTKEDINGFKISSFHTAKHSGVTHIYVEQTVNDIPIYGLITNVNIMKDGNILSAHNQFISDAASKVATEIPTKTPEDAIQGFAGFHNLQHNQFAKRSKSKSEDATYLFKRLDFSQEDVQVQLIYYPIDEDNVRLAWKIEANIKDHTDYWTSILDASSNQHLHSFNHTTSCYFHKDIYTNQNEAHLGHYHKKSNISPAAPQNTYPDGSSYLVYPVPLESPNQGEQQLINEPALILASPFGWHSTDSLEVPESTITRGNNAHAFSNSSGEGRSQEDEPDGGESLDFRFVHDKLGEPLENIDADVTQLFYITNWIHDFSYFFGFNEAAGNFQADNYGNPGRGNDFVISRALERQLDDNIPVTNNARFSASSDGNNGVMFMFPWVASDTDLKITSPGNQNLVHGNPVFGIPDGSQTTGGQIAISFDSGGVSMMDACDSITNAADLAGKIAFVDRGECDFSFKVNNLQEAGAIGVVVCNRDEEIVTMAAGENAELVNIYSSFIRRSTCDSITAILNTGTPVTMELIYTTPIPAQVSGSFDNGVTVHEYGHGVSIRLTGGRNQASCLGNDEQMGEGWSDFLAIVATHKQGDRGEDPRGLGTYLDRLSPSTTGIRRYPYSTDMTINPQTYNDIRFTGFGSLLTNGGRRGEHEVGEIWASTLWDMYWKFIEVYGFNQDWQDTESGNYKAIQLVFDGMKIQPCRPGFIDGRDAILAADQALFNGEHECLIWEVFRRRGLGFDAVQGSSFQREDNFEGFSMAPACQNQIVINKETTDIIQTGDLIDVTITVENNTSEALSAVTVTDVVPTDLSATSLDEFNPQYSEGDEMITFTLGTLQAFETAEITYQLVTPSGTVSLASLSDDFSESILVPQPIFGDITWNLESDIDEGSTWVIPSPVEVFDQALAFSELVRVTGERPVFQFRHKIDVELFFAGADVEVSTNGGQDWESIEKDKFIINGYNDDVVFKDNDALGFTGDSDGFIESVIDLQEYTGQSILLRFRFTSNVGGGFAEVASSKPGWTISNMRIFDLSTYDLNEACLSAIGQEMVCDGATTLIKADDTISTNDELKSEYKFSIFPNPSTGHFTISFDSRELNRADIRISSIDGALIHQSSIKTYKQKHIESIDLSHVNTGIYILELISGSVRIADKLMITAE